MRLGDGGGRLPINGEGLLLLLARLVEIVRDLCLWAPWDGQLSPGLPAPSDVGDAVAASKEDPPETDALAFIIGGSPSPSAKDTTTDGRRS